MCEMQQMMMQQMMMMQQQMNPMMQQQMGGDSQMGRTPPIQVPSRRGTGRQSQRQSQRSVRSSNPASARGVSKASVKDLFSKALNGR